MSAVPYTERSSAKFFPPGVHKYLRLIYWLILLAAAVPLVVWYGGRLSDGGELKSLVALAGAGFFLHKERKFLQKPVPTVLCLCFLGFFAVSSLFLPVLLQISFLVLALVASTRAIRFPGITVLLWLGLPLAASLEYFLEYPLQLITAVIADFGLSSAGMETTRHGVQILYSGTPVGVDPACSGSSLLWSTGLLAGLAAAIFRLSWRGFLMLGSCAFIFCVVGNGLRAALLFFPEAGIVQIPSYGHESVGIAIAVGIFMVLCFCASRLPRWPGVKDSSEVVSAMRYITAIFILGLAIMGPAAANKSGNEPHMAAQEPMRVFRGQAVYRVPLSSSEERFYRSFPGKIDVYEGKGLKVIFRRVEQATRKLHPSSHCFRAEGFLIGEQKVTLEGRPWLCYRITRGGKSYLVHEGISTEADKNYWTNYSAWFWASILGQKEGPWETITFVTDLSEPF